MRNDPAKAKEYFSAKLAFTTGPVELNGMMKTEDDVRVVDVRAEQDYEREHIPGSVNLPRERWRTREALLRDHLNVLLCYSQVCHLAARAAVEFAGDGFSVMELEGGFKAWKEHGLPVESDDDNGVRKQLAKAMDDLRGLRDELRLKIHLAGLDTKDVLDDLGNRLENLELELSDAADVALESIRAKTHELRESFEKLRSKLM
jgi:rhodanese-related sulfurtransferase